MHKIFHKNCLRTKPKFKIDIHKNFIIFFFIGAHSKIQFLSSSLIFLTTVRAPVSIESPSPRRSPRRTQHAHFRAHRRLFGREAGGYGAVLDGVRFVAVLAADGASVGAKYWACDDPVRVFQVVCAVDRLRLAVVFAERAVGVEFWLLSDGFGLGRFVIFKKSIIMRGFEF